MVQHIPERAQRSFYVRYELSKCRSRIIRDRNLHQTAFTHSLTPRVHSSRLKITFSHWEHEGTERLAYRMNGKLGQPAVVVSTYDSFVYWICFATKGIQCLTRLLPNVYARQLNRSTRRKLYYDIIQPVVNAAVYGMGTREFVNQLASCTRRYYCRLTEDILLTCVIFKDSKAGINSRTPMSKFMANSVAPC